MSTQDVLLAREMFFPMITFILNSCSVLAGVIVVAISEFQHRHELKILTCALTGTVLLLITTRNVFWGECVMFGDAVRALVPTILFVLVSEVTDAFVFFVACYFLQAFSMLSFMSKSEDRLKLVPSPYTPTLYHFYQMD